MDSKTFNDFVEFICENHIKGILYSKAQEYAKDEDRLHNFKRASEMSGESAIECLRGMNLKHDVSLDDMLNDEDNGINHPQDLWQEKLHDEINYLLLLWALLIDEHSWELK